MKIELKDFKLKVKEMAVNKGLKKSDISIKTPYSVLSYNVLYITIKTNDRDIFKLLQDYIKVLSGEYSNSDPSVDYFDNNTEITINGNINGNNTIQYVFVTKK